ncbi:hypothetical protein ACIHEI_04095 [Kitasatospora sp. NPDC051984]|uniref:hypothetical protein n=1 Tax=Kitasatospora sp. NPDC051984 TaxID=3364059 RepID=UPI0037CC6402
MADETVWIDLDEVDAAAKKIMSLLQELEGPANQLEAVIKQVEESVYGTDLLGKALKGSGSSVGGLSKHQQQTLTGIRALLKNANAMGQNLQTMAARHRTNDEEHSGKIGQISTSGDMPASPHLAGAQPATDRVGTDRVIRAPHETLAPETDSTPIPPPPAAIKPIGNTDAGDDYHRADAPTLDYNHHKARTTDEQVRGSGPGTRQVI